jgi:molybdate transport system permease protein
MAVNKRGWFGTVLLGAVGFAVSLMLLVLLSQMAYAGWGAPWQALRDPSVQRAILLSLTTATPAAFLALLLATPCAYALARWRFPGQPLVDALLDIPVLLSPVALGFSLLLFFRTPLGRWVEEHTIRFVFDVPGILLAQFFLAFALAVRVLKASFEDIPVRLEQVARFLGCTAWQAFRRVSLPLARPGLLAAFVLGWARAIGDFGATVTLAGAIPGRTETIPISIYLNMDAVRLDRAVALMLVLTTVALSVLLISRWALGNRRT